MKQMKYYGYNSNTKVLFSFQDFFKYEGKIDLNKNNTICWDENQEFEIPLEIANFIASSFLSGCSQSLFSAVDFQKGKVSYSTVQYNSTAQCYYKIEIHPKKYDETLINQLGCICLSGEILNKPKELSKYARKYPYHKIFIPSIGDSSSSFGALLSILSNHQAVKPERLQFLEKNFDHSENSFLLKDYNPSYFLAYEVLSNKKTLNEVYKTPHSDFYGKVISKEISKDCTFFVKHEFAKDFFNEPPSILDFVALSNKTELKTTALFRKITGYNEEVAVVRLVGNDDPFLYEFSNLLNLKFFTSSNLKTDDNLSVVRYNQAYLKKL